MPYFHAFLSFVILISISSCNTSHESSGIKTSQTDRFDLEAFFEQEIAALSLLDSLQVKKKIQHHRQTEEQLINDIDWKQEFGLFLGKSVNDPKIFTAYTEKKKTSTGGKYSLTYRTKNSKLELKHLELHYNNDKLLKLKMQLNNKNQVQNSVYDLTYEPKKSYTIKKYQKVTFFQKDTFIIHGQFVNFP